MGRMTRITFALLLFACAEGHAESPSTLNCWGGFSTPDGLWTGEQQPIRFRLDMRAISARGLIFTKFITAADIPGAQFEGRLYYYARRLAVQGPPTIGIGVFHLSNDEGVILGQALANYPTSTRNIYISGDSHVSGLDEFTLTCRDGRFPRPRPTAG